MGHLCLVPRLGAASTWEAPCSVWGSEGASMMEGVWVGRGVAVGECVCMCVGFWGDPGGCGDFRDMGILGWCFCK